MNSLAVDICSVIGLLALLAYALLSALGIKNNRQARDRRGKLMSRLLSWK